MMRLLLSLLLAAMAADLARAQTSADDAAWPSRPIRFIVPFPAGGSTDVVARIVGQLVGARLGQQFVIENRVGASGALGTETVARAAPDGYTLGLATTTTHALIPSLARNPSYDAEKDFAPVSLIGSSPFVLVTSPNLPAKNLAEFIALAKAKDGALTSGSAGSASLAHLAALLFANTAGVKFTHVPYKASAQSATDLMTGRLDMQFATVGPVLTLIREGKLRALAIASAQRSALLPDVPTFAEAGLAGYQAALWMAIVLPAKTPPAIVRRLNRETVAALGSSETKNVLAAQGMDTETSTPEGLAAYVRDEIGKWRGVIAKAGLTAQ
jgi:tripartite-type tricarboxylate transporter receptor subunit TctC